jgi:hypothetical protein
MRSRHGSFGLADFVMLLAVVLFFLAAAGYGWSRATPWWTGTLIAAGLFCWSLSTVLPG